MITFFLATAAFVFWEKIKWMKEGTSLGIETPLRGQNQVVVAADDAAKTDEAEQVMKLVNL